MAIDQLSRKRRDLQRAIVRLRSSCLIRSDRDAEILEITYGGWLTEMILHGRYFEEENEE